MEENDKQKTAFATHRGLFQYKVMPLGPCNSPATFERLVELVLSGVLFERCLVYIDESRVLERRRRRHCITSGSSVSAVKNWTRKLAMFISWYLVPSPHHKQQLAVVLLTKNYSTLNSRSYQCFTDQHRAAGSRYQMYAQCPIVRHHSTDSSCCWSV